jgi:Holliday junction resolvasome RuvABC endonuclease subunit
LTGTIILGGDPGKTHFGISIFEYPNKTLFNGILAAPVMDFKDPHLKEFVLNVEHLLNKYNPSVLCVERFLSRGFKGNTGEFVTANTSFLAMLFFLKRKIEPQYIMPSEWKMAFNRERGDKEALNKLYDKVKNLYGLSPHRIDSFLIGMYGINKRVLGKSPPYFKAFTESTLKNLGDF